MITLQVDNLAKQFGKVQIFENLSFEAVDTILGIKGPNGSGKSTLLRCLSGLLTPNAGSICWRMQNNEIEKKNIRYHCGYAAPYLNLYDELTVAENLAFLLKLRNKRKKERSISDLLSELGLHDKMDSPYNKLSSGQQQRVKIASALLPDPDILILDEPGTNLDSTGKEHIRQFILKLREKGKFIVLASNEPRELDWCSDVVALLDD